MYLKIKAYYLLLKIIMSSLIPPYEAFYDKAERVCKRAVKKGPNDYYPLWFLSYVFLQNKKYVEAREILKNLYSQGIREKRVVFLLARAHFKLGEYDNVISLLKKRNDISTKDTSAYYLGYSLIEKGDRVKGIVYLKEYLSHHPKEFPIFWKLGSAYYLEGLYDEALDAYLEAEKINPQKEIKDSIKMCLAKLEGTRNVH